MRKTYLARKAFNIYKTERSYLVIPYFIAFVFALCAPAIFINYLYTNVHRLFFIMIPIYIYFSFPIWLGAIVCFSLMANSFGVFFGRKPIIESSNSNFEDLIFKLFGFRIKEDRNGE